MVIIGFATHDPTEGRRVEALADGSGRAGHDSSSVRGHISDALRSALFRAEGPRSRASALIPVGVLVFAVAIALIREGAGIHRVWAEDGAIFFPEERSAGYQHLIFMGYEGYLHLVPRTLTLFAASLPLRDLAVGFAIGAAVVTGLTTMLISRALAAYGLNRWVAAVVSLALPLSPIGLSECLDVACNIQWFLACGCFWALLWCPLERRWLAFASVLALVTAGSAPLVLALAPLALLRLLLMHGRQWSVPLAYGLGSALQLYTMTKSVRTGITHPDSLADLLKTTAARLYTTTWFGLGNTESLFGRLHWGTVALAGVLWLLVLAACIRSARSGVLIIVALLGGSALFLAGTLNNFYSASVAGGQSLAVTSDGRYAVSPGAIFAGASVCALFVAARSRHRSRLARPVLVVVLLTLSLSAVRDFHYTTARDVQQSWESSVAQARVTCAKTPAASVRLTVSPAANFDVTLTCLSLNP